MEEPALEDGETVVDRFEREERVRAEQQIMAAQGYIALREVVSVSVANEGSEDSSFEISLKGGMSIRFEVSFRSLSRLMRVLMEMSSATRIQSLLNGSDDLAR